MVRVLVALSLARSLAQAAVEWDEAKCVLINKKIAFLGDGITRNCFYVFNHFMESGGEPYDLVDGAWADKGEGSADYDEVALWTDWKRFDFVSERHQVHLKKSFGALDASSEFWFIQSAWSGPEATGGDASLLDIAAAVAANDVVVANSGWWDLKREADRSCGEDFSKDGCDDDYKAALGELATQILSKVDVGLFQTSSCCGEDGDSWVASIDAMNEAMRTVAQDRGIGVVETSDLYTYATAEAFTLSGVPNPATCLAHVESQLRLIDYEQGSGCFPPPKKEKGKKGSTTKKSSKKSSKKKKSSPKKQKPPSDVCKTGSACNVCDACCQDYIGDCDACVAAQCSKTVEKPKEDEGSAKKKKKKSGTKKPGTKKKKKSSPKKQKPPTTETPKEEEDEPREKTDIGLFGDSLTEKMDEDVLADFFDDGSEVRNFGVGGRDTYNYPKNDEFAEGLNFKPYYATIMLGTNNAKDYDEDEFKDQYLDLLRDIADATTKAIFVMIPPPIIGGCCDIDADIVNEDLPGAVADVVDDLEDAVDIDVVLVDTPSEWSDRTGCKAPSRRSRRLDRDVSVSQSLASCDDFYHTDGLHLSDDGDEVLARIIFDAIRVYERGRR